MMLRRKPVKLPFGGPVIDYEYETDAWYVVEKHATSRAYWVPKAIFRLNPLHEYGTDS